MARSSQDIRREEAVRRAAERWKAKLVDESGRNRLLNYRDLQVGTLDLTPGPESPVNHRALDALLDGSTIDLRNLFADTESSVSKVAQVGDAQALQTGLFPDPNYMVDARKRLSAIYRRAQVYSDEKGIDTLFAGVGLATWKIDTGSVPNAPVILVPITVSPLDAARFNFRIEVSGDPHLNPVLDYILQAQFSLEQSEQNDELLADQSTSFNGLIQLLRQLEGQWDKVPGLTIEDRIVLGNFSYTKMPMVEDLKNNVAFFAINDFVAAIAGVEEARQSLEANIQEPSPNQPDIDPPESEFLVLDADSSQHRAINRALTGKSSVIWGPPGTGKSQTIANLIATLVANGKSVLFVAEKRAAIDMVVNRLNSKGLSNLVMDIHGGVKSKREFAQSIDASMRNIMSIPESDNSALHHNLSRLKTELIDYEDAVHSLRPAMDMSAYEMFTKLIGAPSSLQNVPQLPSSDAKAINRQGMNRLMENIREWIDLGGPELHSQYPEWDRSNINTPEDARRAFDLVRELTLSILPDARSHLLTFLERIDLTIPDTVGDWQYLCRWLSGVSDLMKRFHQDIYSLEHKSLIAALKPASRWWHSIAPISSKYRAAKKTVQHTRKDGTKLSGIEALKAVVQAQSHLREQPRDFHGFPKAPDDLIAIRTKVQELSQSLNELGNLLSRGDLLNTPHKGLEEMLSRLASQREVVANLTRIRNLERQFAAAGIDRITALVGKKIQPEYAEAAVEHSWLKAVSDDILFADPQLSKFTQDAHSRHREHFIELDHRHLETSAERIKRAAAEAAIETMNTYRQETDLLRLQAGRKRGHLSIRQLFRRAPNVLTAIRPCWTMSPLLVAEILPHDTGLFDVVIFDEASQIPPAEAIGSLARAPQTVIAGDDRQLPPTNVFQKQEADDLADDKDDDEEDEYSGAVPIEDYESMLDVAKSNPIRQDFLKWHYRSRDDRLIAFSNTYIYGDGLTTFPGVSVTSPFSFHLVPFRPIPKRSTRSHPDEVTKVVDMIIEHAQENPDESLGVITFGIQHANNIDDALRARLREMDTQPFEKFFSEESSERFFIKNIERVQGDERDVIILSVGYHKDAKGDLPYRFGPLNQEGGERRLNVAITRARSRMHIVSSFSHHDMDPDKSNARGVELLRRYLEFVSSGGTELPSMPEGNPLNGFELDVKNRLEAKGIPLIPQYGTSGYRIDFACAHPNQPGRMVLAIEADGSIHKMPTVRDRDRLRQEVLEDKGWRFHRIESTKWDKNRDKETERAFEAWKEAVRLADIGLSTSIHTAPKGNKSPEPKSAKANPRPRGPRPRIRPGKKIDEYSHRELVTLALWINSDTLLRTDVRLMAIMRQELGFKRRGSRIDAALTNAIATMHKIRSKP